VSAGAGVPIRIHAGIAISAAALAYATAVAALFVYGSMPRHRAEAAWFIASATSLIFLAATSSTAAAAPISCVSWPARRDLLITGLLGLLVAWTRPPD
jgi:hypothetical protein